MGDLRRCKLALDRKTRTGHADHCIAGICSSCLPFTAACTSNGQCCSGNCTTDFLGNRSCGL